MESSRQKRRFPPPWKVEPKEHGYDVQDANGFRLATVYCDEAMSAAKWTNASHLFLTRDEARRIAKAIARIPEFLRGYAGFEKRGATRIGRWRFSHPYHVALQNSYVQENFDEIVACCRFNNVPFDATGEKLERGFVRWLVYEFERQIDAIRFWDKFDGRWLVKDEFVFPERPDDLPRMKSLKHRGAI